MSYSIPIDKKLYANKSEFFSQFTPRIHKQYSLADDACLQCQIDLFTVYNVGTFYGTANPSTGNWVSLTFPECLPERLPLIAYSYELAFVIDDLVDSQKDIAGSDKELEFVINPLDASSDHLQSQSRIKREVMVSKMAAKFLEFDPIQGKTVVESWKTFAKSRSTIHGQSFQSIDEYIKFRNAENGWELALNLAHFGYDLAFTDIELASIGRVQAPILSAVTLANDYFSWEKEYQVYCKSGRSTPLLNAVHLIKDWHSASDSDAKVILKDIILGLEKEYISLKSDYLLRNPDKPNALKWFDCLETIASGNMLWSISCPRYSIDAPNPYSIYYEARCQQGVAFFSDSTEQHEIIPGYSPKKAPPRASNGHPNGYVNGSIKEITDGNHLEQGSMSSTPCPSIEASVALQSLRLQPMDETPVIQAAAYIQSLPSKNIRKIMITALNSWYQVPGDSLPQIQSIVDLLHTGSLMIDDIQDGSAKRRGMPSAHSIFGASQTINAAMFLFVKSCTPAMSLGMDTFKIFVDELENLHVGQGYDLLWTYHATAPSEEVYMQMVDRKTGGLFRLSSRLMQLHATKNKDVDLTEFMALLGRFFQIRDDYQNLISAEYHESKGFCEDLDEGKMSFPLIHALSLDKGLIKAVLESLKRKKSLSHAEKVVIVKQLESGGSLEYTLKTVKGLLQSLWLALYELEQRTQTPNWLLRLLLYKLAI